MGVIGIAAAAATAAAATGLGETTAETAVVDDDADDAFSPPDLHIQFMWFKHRNLKAIIFLCICLYFFEQRNRTMFGCVSDLALQTFNFCVQVVPSLIVLSL